MMLAFALVFFARLIAATTITTDPADTANKSFDYIIAGGGLTGITVANKLSSQGYSVLIIEAGPDARSNSAVYNAEERGNLNGYCNWQYPAYDENGNALSWTIDSGACIGGSTSINGMVWYRPTKKEIDTLELLGNKGWNWDALEPYMEAIENFTPPDTDQLSDGAAYDPAVHGYNGAVNTSFPVPMRIPKAQALYKEALPLVFNGLAIGDDLSNRSTIQAASTSWTIWYDPVTGKNRRSSAADALLWAEDQQRESLTVLAEHVVSKVLFKSSRDLTAKGVQFGNSSSKNLYNVYANKEVLLAAGSLASSPILERSGIGSKSTLNKLGIKTLYNLPGVGLNLNDQPGTGTSALVQDAYLDDTELIDGRNLFTPVISLVNIDEIFASDSVSLAKNLTSGLVSRAKSLVSVGASASQKSALSVLGAATNLIANLKLPVAEFVGESYPSVFTAVFWPLTPLSRGWIHITSSDPFTLPQIVPRLLSDDFDLKVAVAVARKSRELFQSSPFSEYVSDAFADPSSLGANATDDEYASWLKSTSYGASHWIGSTSMLPEASGGVVSPELKVYGTKNLRVVDAGILPFQITSHTMSTAYSIAQRAADLILSDA
ncbi:alcohol oxidase [Pyrrhoderma noxium]|uniref:Alcohol oxidase n=1 Tax=Pyrrhoderma noxium TaxID=2282107 RepID=A0A286ULQ3_9AGAM|nr:alcohol oxidase [Pyrrhoderma noxium]